MKLGTCTSSPGKKVKGSLTLTKHKGSAIKIPLILAEGLHEGPTVMISAGIHGNEINGIEILRQFVLGLDPRQLSGNLVILPVLNVGGFHERIRYVPLDGKDFNRSFEPARRGTVSQRMANTLLNDVAARCDFGIDLHDAGDQNILLPHSRVHMGETDGCTHELGAIFGTEIVMEREGNPGMFAVQSYKQHHVPILTVEIGGGMIIWDDFVPVGLRGIRNMLIQKKMLTGTIELPTHQFFLSRREGYISPMDGIVRLTKSLGDGVLQGESLGKIVNPATGQSDEINAYRCGVVLSKRQQAVIQKGETALSILHIAHCEINKRKPSDASVRMVVNEQKEGHSLTGCAIYTEALALETTHKHL